jgi:hypothetical protein
MLSKYFANHLEKLITQIGDKVVFENLSSKSVKGKIVLLEVRMTTIEHLNNYGNLTPIKIKYGQFGKLK